MTEYERMCKILEDLTELAKELRQKPSRRDREDGYRAWVQTKALAKTFLNYMDRGGCDYETVLKEFGKITG